MAFFFLQMLLCSKFMDLICLLDDPLISATSRLPWTDGLEKEAVDDVVILKLSMGAFVN